MAFERGRGGGAGYGLSKVYLRGGVGVDELAGRHTQVYIYTHTHCRHAHTSYLVTHTAQGTSLEILPPRMRCGGSAALHKPFLFPKGKFLKSFEKCDNGNSGPVANWCFKQASKQASKHSPLPKIHSHFELLFNWHSTEEKQRRHYKKEFTLWLK